MLVLYYLPQQSILIYNYLNNLNPQLHKMSSYKHKNPVSHHQHEQMRQELERETAKLLAERRSLQGIPDNRMDNRNPTRQIYSQSQAITPVAHYKGNEHKTQEVINRLQQIIHLCKEEGTLSNDQMRQVVRVENQVLNYLQKNIQIDEKSENNKKATPRIHDSKIQVNQTWGKQNARDQINVPMSQDTLEMIAQIQRKALSEIIHLQKERDTIKQERDRLLDQLNKVQNQPFRGGNEQGDRLRQQNRLLIEQNNALLYRLDNFSRKGDNLRGPVLSMRQEPLGHQQYDSNIALYENQLKKAVMVINELKMRLSNVPGLEQLHDQGQRIRRQTSQLLQLRKGNQNSSFTRELQQRLEEQQRGKQAFLQELKVFKQRYLQLEEENRALKKSKVSFDPVPRPVAYESYTPERLSAPSRGIIKKKAGFADFESAIHEMRSALE